MKVIILLFTLLSVTFSKKTYQFVFPDSARKPQVQLHDTIDHPLMDYTLCYWLKTSGNSDDFNSIFSYRTNNSPRTIKAFTGGNGEYRLYQDNALVVDINTGMDVLYWNQLCVTSSVLRGTLNVFANGVKIKTDVVKNQIRSIPPNGIVVLGGISNNWPFKGYIADLFMWDRILSPREVALVFTCNFTQDANVINWDLHSWEGRNGVLASLVDLSCGKKIY